MRPYEVALSTAPPTLTESKVCMQGALGDGVGWNAGTEKIEARISAQPNNAVSYGSDGGLYVNGQPYTCAQAVSCAQASLGKGLLVAAGKTDIDFAAATPNNALGAGSDGGIYGAGGAVITWGAWTNITTGFANSWSSGLTSIAYRVSTDGSKLAQLRGALNIGTRTNLTSIINPMPAGLPTPEFGRTYFVGHVSANRARIVFSIEISPYQMRLVNLNDPGSTVPTTAYVNGWLYSTV